MKLPKTIKVRPRDLTPYEREQYPHLKRGLAVVSKPAVEGGQRLSLDGEMVPATTYWLRRIKAGDVIVMSTNHKEPKAQHKQKKA